MIYNDSVGNIVDDKEATHDMIAFDTDYDNSNSSDKEVESLKEKIGTNEDENDGHADDNNNTPFSDVNTISNIVAIDDKW